MPTSNEPEANSDFSGPLRRVRAGVLDAAYLEFGPASGGAPVAVLLHGFPYDVHACTEAAVELAAHGLRVLVPYLRGYGPTRFVDANTPRSGEQAALGADLLALLDALGIERALLGGYDWGGRAACIVAALWPERCAGLVTVNGYNVQQIARSAEPLAPEQELRLWYQFYLHGERGRRGLEQNRRALCRLLWRLWSPTWRFDDATFERSAAALENPDFVDVVVHSYRHRYALVAGDPAYADIEARLAQQPAITVPAIVLEGLDDGVHPPRATPDHAPRFARMLEHRLIANTGHNLPQEQPRAFAQAVLDVLHGDKG